MIRTLVRQNHIVILVAGVKRRRLRRNSLLREGRDQLRSQLNNPDIPVTANLNKKLSPFMGRFYLANREVLIRTLVRQNHIVILVAGVKRRRLRRNSLLREGQDQLRSQLNNPSVVSGLRLQHREQ